MSTIPLSNSSADFVPGMRPSVTTVSRHVPSSAGSISQTCGRGGDVEGHRTGARRRGQIMGGRIQSGAQTEEQVRLKEAEMAAEREHVAVTSEARDPATHSATQPGILERIRRLLRRD